MTARSSEIVCAGAGDDETPMMYERISPLADSIEETSPGPGGEEFVAPLSKI